MLSVRGSPNVSHGLIASSGTQTSTTQGNADLQNLLRATSSSTLSIKLGELIDLYDYGYGARGMGPPQDAIYGNGRASDFESRQSADIFHGVC